MTNLLTCENIAEQFEEWDHAMDNIYFDEETGQLMQSVTVPGGDVIQIPYEKEEELKSGIC